MTARTRNAIAILLVIKIACVSGILFLRLWDARADIRYPSAYLTRLEWLDGAHSSLDGMDCAKFIANAHGDELTFVYWKTKTDVVRTFAKRADIDESLLRAGDVANFNGQHVAVFLGSGIWIDADYRRGNVSKFRLADKPETDPWFQGPITIRRFKEMN